MWKKVSEKWCHVASVCTHITLTGEGNITRNVCVYIYGSGCNNIRIGVYFIIYFILFFTLYN